MTRLRIKDEGLHYSKDLLGERICTGARMGMSNILPLDKSAVLKYRMVKTPIDSGGYAENGAYFGLHRDPLYYAESVDEVELENISTKGKATFYVRVSSREEAKATIINKVPGAKFFR